MKSRSKNRNTFRHGFSLIELLVASALFTVVVAVSAGSFLAVLDASKQSRELGKLMLEVDFATEDMSRTMRTGTFSTIPTGQNNVSFTDQSGRTVEYRLQNGVIQKRVVGANGVPVHPFLALTSNSISVTHLRFSTTSPTPSSDQPRIIINVVGNLGSSPDDTFYLQTSVTQRLLNI